MSWSFSTSLFVKYGCIKKHMAIILFKNRSFKIILTAVLYRMNCCARRYRSNVWSSNYWNLSGTDLQKAWPKSQQNPRVQPKNPATKSRIQATNPLRPSTCHTPSWRMLRTWTRVSACGRDWYPSEQTLILWTVGVLRSTFHFLFTPSRLVARDKLYNQEYLKGSLFHFLWQLG